MSWIAFSTPGHGLVLWYQFGSRTTACVDVFLFRRFRILFCFDSSNLLCEGISWFLFWKVGLTITALVTDFLHRISVKT